VLVSVLLVVAAWVALFLVLQPLARRAPIWPAVEPLPFALLAGAAAVLDARWEEIPERFAVHFAIDGRVNGWAPRTPAAVYAPLLLGAGIVGLLILLRAAIALLPASALGTPAAAASRRHGGAVLLGVEVMVAALCATVSFLALGATLGMVLGVVGAGLVLLFLGIGWNVVILTRRPPDGGATPGGWRAGGLVYGDPADPALWVPKRIGIGWTLNFGHPAAWWVFWLLLLLPLGVVAAVGIAVATASR
jgi:uncharacterized membrane protein